MRDNIGRLKDLSERYHFQAVVLTYPQIIDREINRTIRAAASEFDLPLIDLGYSSGLFAHDPKGAVSRDGYHPNEKGYRMIAEAVGRRLLRTLK